VAVRSSCVGCEYAGEGIKRKRRCRNERRMEESYDTQSGDADGDTQCRWREENKHETVRCRPREESENCDDDESM